MATLRMNTSKGKPYRVKRSTMRTFGLRFQDGIVVWAKLAIPRPGEAVKYEFVWFGQARESHLALYDRWRRSILTQLSAEAGRELRMTDYAPLKFQREGVTPSKRFLAGPSKM
jgi:hypothetical protein